MQGAELLEHISVSAVECGSIRVACDPAVTLASKLLRTHCGRADARCMGPVGTKWEENPEYAWTWPESLRQFVIDQE